MFSLTKDWLIKWAKKKKNVKSQRNRWPSTTTENQEKQRKKKARKEKENFRKSEKSKVKQNYNYQEIFEEEVLRIKNLTCIIFINITKNKIWLQKGENWKEKGEKIPNFPKKSIFLSDFSKKKKLFET